MIFLCVGNEASRRMISSKTNIFFYRWETPKTEYMNVSWIAYFLCCAKNFQFSCFWDMFWYIYVHQFPTHVQKHAVSLFRLWNWFCLIVLRFYLFFSDNLKNNPCLGVQQSERGSPEPQEQESGRRLEETEREQPPPGEPCGQRPVGRSRGLRRQRGVGEGSTRNHGNMHQTVALFWRKKPVSGKSINPIFLKNIQLIESNEKQLPRRWIGWYLSNSNDWIFFWSFDGIS